MKKGAIARIAAVCVLAASMLAVGKVYATWQYASGPLDSVTDNFNIVAFPWEGSEILPDDVVGLNHKELIYNILNGKMTDSNGNEVGIGLNTPSSELNEQLSHRDRIGKVTFGSMDAWDSAQMHALFGLEAAKLSFMMYMPENEPNTKYLYTTGVDLGESGWFSGKPNIPIGERVYPIYRTKLVYDFIGKNEAGEDVYEWVAEQTVLGSAVSQYYDNDYFGSGVVKSPAFNPTSFAPLKSEDCQAGETAVMVGATAATGIYSYVGETHVEVAGKTEKTYFRLKPASSGTITITMTEKSEHLQVAVYSDANLTNAVETTKTNNVVTFTAKANTLYYIEMTGDNDLQFTITQG